MGIQFFEIIFSNVENNYFSGSIVSGSVCVYTSSNQKIKGIKLKLTGAAKLHWDHVNYNINDSEKLLEEYINILGYRDTSIVLPLMKGRHRFKFNFELPKGIPSSFNHKLGHVKYFLEATICCISDRREFRSNKEIIVRGIENVEGLEENYMKIVKEKEIGCLCGLINFGSVLVNFNLPSFARLGENIKFHAKILNNTRENLYPVLKIYKVIKFNSLKYNISKMNKTLVKEAYCTKVEAGERVEFSNENFTFEIPMHYTPTNLAGRNLKIIELNYYIQLKIKIKTFFTLKEKIELKVVGQSNCTNDTEDDDQQDDIFWYQGHLANIMNNVHLDIFNEDDNSSLPSYSDAVEQLRNNANLSPPDYNSVNNIN